MAQKNHFSFIFDNELNWPKSVQVLSCKEFSNCLLRTRSRLESEDFKVFISNHIQKYETFNDQSHLRHKKETLKEIIEDLEYLQSLVCNGDDFSTYREKHYFLYSNYCLYNETMELMIYFCEMNEFALLLNQFFVLEDHKIYDGQGIEKFYEMICGFIETHHSLSKSSIFLKSWLLLIRLIAKPKKDNLHKYVSEKIFKKVFVHLVQDINEISFSAVLYHYLYHYWDDIVDEIILSNLKVRSSNLTQSLVLEYKDSLSYLSLIYSAYQKYEKIIQFDFDPYYNTGEVELILKLVEIDKVFMNPITNTFYPEDEYKVHLDKDLGEKSISLFFEFLSNKHTNDFISFIQNRNILSFYSKY